MKQEGVHMEKHQKDISWDRIEKLLWTGIIGACVILAGDLLMGWGVRDPEMTGIAGQLSPYLAISDRRMFWAFLCGLAGVPAAVAGHFGIYKLLKPYSDQYARLYAVGNLGFLIFGGAGVHGCSVAAAFFYKYMAAADPAAGLEAVMKFAVYFLLPMYVLVLAGWFLMVCVHFRAVSRGLSPYPRWCVIFSMLTGSVLASLIGFFGNHEIVNAIMTGAFSLGNIWSLAGHLLMLRRVKMN